MKYLILIAVITITTIQAGLGQTAWSTKRDSLLNVLSRSKEDTNKALTILWISVGYIDNQPDSAIYYAKALGKLSKELHFTRGITNSLSIQAAVLSGENKPDEAIALDLEAIELAKKANLKGLADFYNNTAIIYNDKGDYTSSLDLYLKAAAIYEQRHDSSSMAFIYGNIAGVYNNLKEYYNGYTYSLKDITICRSLNQVHGFGSGMVNLSTALINLERYDTALVVLKDSKNFLKTINDKNEEVSVLANIDYAYIATGKLDLLQSNAQELLAIATSIGNKQGICFGLFGLKDYFIYKKDYAKATSYAREAIDTAVKNNLVILQREAYKEAARVEVAQGNLEAFDRYDRQKDSIDNIILSDKILNTTQDLEAKYSLNKKQVQIDELGKEKKIAQLTLKQRNTLNWILAIAILVFIFIATLYYRNYQQKKKLLSADALLQQQRIIELEKEKQLLATMSVLQGQVEERSRLAKDLHDGLGGILSSAKYSFTIMKENLIISPENANAFDKSLAMLDKSISELRRVAHNLMPEALMQFGLDTALKDFCNTINQGGAIQLVYQSFEMDENSISKNSSSAIYRIIQELVNNILKHANAQTALVQLIRKNNALSITVEDNGKGFDKTILQNSDGIGYLNLQNRVTYLSGTIDILSATGNGTSVHIEIPNIAA
jgi:two-component system NarL family sensor kinase